MWIAGAVVAYLIVGVLMDGHAARFQLRPLDTGRPDMDFMAGAPPDFQRDFRGRTGRIR